MQESAGKLSEAELAAVQGRADVITYAVLAEMNLLQAQRTADFKLYLQQYLHGQLDFYAQVYAAGHAAVPAWTDRLLCTGIRIRTCSSTCTGR